MKMLMLKVNYSEAVLLPLESLVLLAECKVVECKSFDDNTWTEKEGFAVELRFVDTDLIMKPIPSALIS